MNLASKCLHVKLVARGSTWDRKNAKETDEWRAAKKVEAYAGRVNTLQLPKEICTKLNAPGNAARIEFRRLTMPFRFLDGSGITAITCWQGLKDSVDVFISQQKDAVDWVCANLPQIALDLRAKLNGAWDEDSFPSENDIRAAYSIELRVMPMPDLTAIANAIIPQDELRAEIERETAAAVAEIEHDMRIGMLEKVLEPVQEASAKIALLQSGEHKQCHSTLTKNVADAAQVVKQLNAGIDNDPAIAALADKAAVIGAFPALTLNTKDAEPLRVALKTQTDELAEQIRKAMEAVV